MPKQTFLPIGKSAGFGLAEVLLASGVLIMVVASIVALSRFVIRGYALTASRTQALYLSQEGVERVRNIRDSYWIDNDPTTDFAALPPIGVTYPCVVTWNGSTGRWRMLAGTESLTVGGVIYERRIDVIKVPAGTLGDPDLDQNTIHVMVIVTWQEGGRTHTVTTDTYLTNWKPES
jgi:hypothetical protein